MSKVGFEISKSIKESKWLYIHYENASNEKTFYWCAVVDIELTMKLKVVIFNHDKSPDTMNTKIRFSRILHAEVLEGTFYDVPLSLVSKLEASPEKFDWLNYDQYNQNILEYYKKCAFYDYDPYYRDSTLIEGIDAHVLLNNEGYNLNSSQLEIIVNYIRGLMNSKTKSHFGIETRELSINRLAIQTSKGLYVVAYQNIVFNPHKKSLVLAPTIHINPTFLIGEYKHSLSHYMDMDVEEFKREFNHNSESIKEILADTLPFHEKLDELPHIIEIMRRVNVNYELEFDAIKKMQEDNKLTVPLRAFFGNMNTKYLRRTLKPIALLDDKVNIDQLRVIHNAFKQPITYVQGPPGTGKTQTILNIIVTAMLNEETVLITSNNNHPIDSIYEKMRQITFKDSPIPFPILRLGNRDLVHEALNTIKQGYESLKGSKANEKRADKRRSSFEKNLKALNRFIEAYEDRLDIEENIDAIKTIMKHLKDEFRIASYNAELDDFEAQLNKMQSFKDEDAHELLPPKDYVLYEWLFEFSKLSWKKLLEPKYKPLIAVFNKKDPDERITEFNRYLKEDKNVRDFLKVFPVILTTNISSARLGSPTQHFDLTVIDEAGQCTISTSLLPILRGERLVLVGDPNQLEPVTVIEPKINERLKREFSIPKTYDYTNNSILKVMQERDVISKFILLRYHYRSHKKIIDFSNQKYYENQLIIESRMIHDDPLEYVDVKNQAVSSHFHRNTAVAEVTKILDIIKQNPKKSIGVITPFRNQANLLQDHIREHKFEHVDVGTVHTFQGDEKETIILSCAVTQSTIEKTFDWAKNNRELINVATTRAKNKLIVVGDFNQIQKRSHEANDLNELIRYVHTKGQRLITKSKDSFNYSIYQRKSLNSKFEEEFLKTLEHLFSTTQRYEVKEKVGIKSVLPRAQTSNLEYYFKAEFDFVVYDRITKMPVTAIELDGKEHIENRETIERDKKKEEICNYNKLKLIRIPNNYVRRYEYIRNRLISLFR